MKLILLSAVFLVSVIFFSRNMEAVTMEPDAYLGSGLSASDSADGDYLVLPDLGSCSYAPRQFRSKAP